MEIQIQEGQDEGGRKNKFFRTVNHQLPFAGNKKGEASASPS
jgi:hypothetical protein